MEWRTGHEIHIQQRKDTDEHKRKGGEHEQVYLLRQQEKEKTYQTWKIDRTEAG